MTTSNDPDEIRADIERTRATLSNDVDDLAESVKPKSVARRQVDKVKDAAGSVKDRVMGSDEDDTRQRSTVRGQGAAAKDAVADKAYAAKDTVSEKASEAAEVVREAPTTVKRKAQGNPLAAGVIAFGLGMLVSSLDSFQREGAAGGLPAAGESRAGEGEGLRGSEGCGRKPEAAAQEAAESVKTTAQEGVESVKQEGQDGGSRRQRTGSGLQGDGPAANQLSSFVAVVDSLL